MKLLLDTHIFLWWSENSSRLPAQIRALLTDRANLMYLSIASFWEMQIKQQAGKLQLKNTLRTTIENEQVVNGLKTLPVTAEHIFALQELPPIHKDPFDRILIAQSVKDGLKLLSVDGVFEQYGISTKWC